MRPSKAELQKQLTGLEEECVMLNQRITAITNTIIKFKEQVQNYKR